MSAKIIYEFSAVVWQYSGSGGWFFVSLPEDISLEIRSNLKFQEEGWGRLKVEASVGKSNWDTSIWYDTKLNRYLLPLKSDIRKKEIISKDMIIDVFLKI